MFYMLSCFDLKPGASPERLRQALADLEKHLQSLDLLHEAGPIRERQRHPVMDTDDERDHCYCLIMTFRDRDQCDASVEHVSDPEGEGNNIHRAVWQQVDNPVFSCWQDIQANIPGA